MQKSAAYEMKNKFRFGNIIGFIILILVTIIMLLPVYYMVITSVKSNTEVLVFPPTLVPKSLAFNNYINIFSKINYAGFYKNSLIIAALATFGVVLSSSFISFGLARYNARAKNVIFMIIISTLLLPYPALIIPQFLVFKNFGWIDTYLPLIVPAFFGNAYFIFLLRQFFTTLPDDLFDAAKIDGSSEFRTWWNIAMPLCGPALATVAIFQFLWCWNDLIDPVIYLNSENMYTLPIGMASLVSHFRIVPWNLIMAGNIMAMVPILIIFFRAQKYFVEGIALSGIK